MTTTPQSQRAKRGDVVLVLFPNSDLRTAKPRPALVVQADHLNTGLPQLIVAMITSKMFRAGHPSRVAVLLSAPEGQQSQGRVKVGACLDTPPKEGGYSA